MEEEQERGSEYNSRDPWQRQEDAGLPEHLSNFKEFHSLPPPSSSKFIVLNRRIKQIKTVPSDVDKYPY